jgi:hypothetical protein
MRQRVALALRRRQRHRISGCLPCMTRGAECTHLLRVPCADDERQRSITRTYWAATGTRPKGRTWAASACSTAIIARCMWRAFSAPPRSRWTCSSRTALRAEFEEWEACDCKLLRLIAFVENGCCHHDGGSFRRANHACSVNSSVNVIVGLPIMTRSRRSSFSGSANRFRGFAVRCACAVSETCRARPRGPLER